MKTRLRLLPLWLTIASLITPLLGQSVSELELEKSSNLNVWESVTITPEMISNSGKLLVPTSGSQQFYRMKVRLLQAPSISSPPPATTGIEEGESVTFTVQSQGVGLTYQWYLGQSGDTSQPIQGATSQSYNTGALTEDASYWVRVTNFAGSSNSETAAVTINRPPTIASHPSSQTIIAGSTATLTVSATGPSPFTYQWYRGNLGATTAPVGTNSPTFTTPTLTATTKYWVKISNAFGETQSSSVTVTVLANTAPTISDIAAQSINVGGNTGALAFTIGDAQTAASSLTLSGSSSNTTLVPNASIVFGGSGASRTVTVTPANGQSGTATITVTVSDSSLTASDTFVLTVNTAPTISDIAAQSITAGDSTGSVAFTVGDSQTAASSLTLSGSSSNTTLVPNASIVFGGSGASRTVTVTPASGQSGTATITVTVSDGSLTASDTFVLTVNIFIPYNFALIQSGDSIMGNSVTADADISNAPLRTVTLDSFFISKHEITKGDWDNVRSWGTENGYDITPGLGKASNHPVQKVSWHDVVKWCNARSEMEGLTPAYYTDDAQTTIYKTGTVDVTNAQVKWTANGYRLPTEAEWEKAARGGLSGKRFPWGDTISHSQANYFRDPYYNYDKSTTGTYHPTYRIGLPPYTSPAETFGANNYGLHNMAGNVREWCWDRYGNYDLGNQSNPRGFDSGTNRVCRGGSFDGNASTCRVAYRDYNFSGDSFYDVGFRVVRSSAP
ncbi:MAG: SUMF1/EgtB/PvdO family nonheme iron enzyme [Verrucomicrobiota bacterium]